MKRIVYFLLACATIVACGKKDDHHHHHDDMAKKNEARFQEFYDKVFNAHNVSLIDSFVTEDFYDQQLPPGYSRDRSGLKTFMADYFAAYPDINAKINFMKAWGDTVMAHITMTGTNNGPFMGMPATNKQINIEGVDIIILKDGKATHHWGYSEDLKMLEQLGLMGGAPADTTKK